MRTTVTIDDAIVLEAKKTSGIKSTSKLINEALDEYNRNRDFDELAALGGSLPDTPFTMPPRRRF